MSVAPRRILIAPDSFKGTFAATEVAAAIARGVEDGGGEADRCPVADGGEGTLAALLAAGGGKRLAAPAHDPLRREIAAEFGLLDDGETAVVEVAAASGLPLLAAGELDPERADSFGTGELIAAAAQTGARTILVAAGGSATTDGGRGAIEAIGGCLRKGAICDPLAQTPPPELGATLEVLCDVSTTYEDAARVFGPQKGADAAAVARLGARLEEFAATLPRDPRGIPMGGCAGGLSGGLYGALGAHLRPGARYVLERVGFAARLARADAVISGEGRLDSQSLEGKLVGTIAALCAEAGVPLHVVVGQNRLDRDLARRAGIASVLEAGSAAAMADAGRRIASL